MSEPSNYVFPFSIFGRMSIDPHDTKESEGGNKDMNKNRKEEETKKKDKTGERENGGRETEESERDKENPR